MNIIPTKVSDTLQSVSTSYKEKVLPNLSQQPPPTYIHVTRVNYQYSVKRSQMINKPLNAGQGTDWNRHLAKLLAKLGMI